MVPEVLADRVDDVVETAAAWRAAGRRVAWAVVVKTWGSAPRRPGSRLVVAESGEFVGSVSGGCVEAAVVEQALGCLAAGTGKLLHFGVSAEQAWSVGLACGGELDVWVEPVPGLLDELVAARRALEPMVLVTELTDHGSHQLLRAGQGGDLSAAAEGALASDAPTRVETPMGPALLEPFLPPLRLVIVGAVHIARPLARMASVAGFAVTVVDPRRAFTLPEVPRLTVWPDAGLAALAPDRRTAIVTLTHDPKLDDPALQAALKSPAFYVGCLGSGKTHAARRQRLTEAGFSDADLARLHGPVGLAIGARTAEEIAVSILAEVIATLRGAVP